MERGAAVCSSAELEGFVAFRWASVGDLYCVVCVHWESSCAVSRYRRDEGHQADSRRWLLLLQVPGR